MNQAYNTIIIGFYPDVYRCSGSISSLCVGGAIFEGRHKHTTSCSLQVLIIETNPTTTLFIHCMLIETNLTHTINYSFFSLTDSVMSFFFQALGLVELES